MAIPRLSVEELIYFDEKKEKDKRDEVRDEGGNKDIFQNSREEDKK